MKISDFKLLSTMPEDYDYSIFDENGRSILVLGKNFQHMIGYRIIDNELRPVTFEVEPKDEQYR